MYNKLFSKILDSSIWLEPTPSRIVFFTFLAAMDGDGFAPFASVANLAHRARVTIEEAQSAVVVLEAPDIDSSDPENEGRRIERVPGGWLILNAKKYRDLATAEEVRVQTRERVRRFRARLSNANITQRNEKLTLSEAEAEAEEREKAKKPERPIFQGQRLVVFAWMQENLEAVLGNELVGFRLGDWFRALDTSIAGNGATDTDWPWLRKQLIREIRKRGIPLDSENVIREREKDHPREYPEFNCQHDPHCSNRNQCKIATQLNRPLKI